MPNSWLTNAKQAANNNLAAMRDSILLWGAEVFAQQPKIAKSTEDLMANQEFQTTIFSFRSGLFKGGSEDFYEVDAQSIVKTLKTFLQRVTSSKFVALSLSRFILIKVIFD